MKTFFSVLLFTLQYFFICKISVVQNLVPNHSFEVYDTCPDFYGQIIRANNWFQPTLGTPDYFNECYTEPFYNYADVPLNMIGYQQAASGKAYAGLVAFWSGLQPEYREYIEVRLLKPLEANIKYYVHFFVTLADASIFATDQMGIYFSVDSIYTSTSAALGVLPQVKNLQGLFISDTTHWLKIEGEYIATGGEDFILIGNFMNQENTDAIQVLQIDSSELNPFIIAYYWVDDICVTADSSTCDYELSSNDPIGTSIFYCFMDYTNQLCLIQSTFQVKNVEFINVLGQIEDVQNLDSISGRISINIRYLPAGTYLIKVTTEKKVFISKVLVIH